MNAAVSIVFDDDDELEAMYNNEYTTAATTLMWEAASAGDLGMCRFLFEHGAASTLHKKDDYGWTPMFAACFQGHLDVAKWLFEVGAVEDVRAAAAHGDSPMFAACCEGHLDVAKWLFAVGAAEDIRTKDDDDWTPMRIACIQTHHHVALWLILQGAANNDEGHVDPAILQQDVPALFRPGLIQPLQLLGNEHKAFTSLVLTAVRFAYEPQEDNSLRQAKRRAGPTPRCALALFRGHEDGVLLLIADFAGVVRGRQLRNAREALLAFGIIGEFEAGE